MDLRDSLFIGIDPTSSHKEFTYAALDQQLNLTALADADMEELVAFLDGQENMVAAINAPVRVNNGSLRRKLEGRNLTRGQILRGSNMRMAEYELRAHGIMVTGVPGRAENCPSWMRTGFRLYKELSEMGFVPLGEEDANRLWVETQPHACFCALLEMTPLPKSTLEGRLQRQLALYDTRMGVKDPMWFFQELTRFKLMKGQLPLETLYSFEQLDALAAAYTAWMAANQPLGVTRVGDLEEGQVVLPARRLREDYR